MREREGWEQERGRGTANEREREKETERRKRRTSPLVLRHHHHWQGRRRRSSRVARGGGGCATTVTASPMKCTCPLALLLGFLMDDKDDDSVIVLGRIYWAFMEDLWMFNGLDVSCGLFYMNACFCNFLTHMQWIELILVPNDRSSLDLHFSILHVIFGLVCCNLCLRIHFQMNSDMHASACVFLWPVQRIVVFLVPNRRSSWDLHLGMWFVYFGWLCRDRWPIPSWDCGCGFARVFEKMAAPPRTSSTFVVIATRFWVDKTPWGRLWRCRSSDH